MSIWAEIKNSINSNIARPLNEQGIGLDIVERKKENELKIDFSIKGAYLDSNTTVLAFSLKGNNYIISNTQDGAKLYKLLDNDESEFVSILTFSDGGTLFIGTNANVIISNDTVFLLAYNGFNASRAQKRVCSFRINEDGTVGKCNYKALGVGYINIKGNLVKHEKGICYFLYNSNTNSDLKFVVWDGGSYYIEKSVGGTYLSTVCNNSFENYEIDGKVCFVEPLNRLQGTCSVYFYDGSNVSTYKNFVYTDAGGISVSSSSSPVELVDKFVDEQKRVHLMVRVRSNSISKAWHITLEFLNSENGGKVVVEPLDKSDFYSFSGGCITRFSSGQLVLVTSALNVFFLSEKNISFEELYLKKGRDIFTDGAEIEPVSDNLKKEGEHLHVLNDGLCKFVVYSNYYTLTIC